MSKKTDIQQVRKASKLLFDVVEIKPNPKLDFGAMFVCHPYTNTGLVGHQDENGLRMLNIVDNLEDQKIWRERMYKMIDISSLEKIHALIDNPWQLTWLRFIKPYLSKEDFSRLLGEIWVSQENPNGDVNVTLRKAISWFKYADKSHLMTKADYDTYMSLPDEFEVYRGVSVGREKDGLSYTTNLDKAKWFQSRFAQDNNKGYLIKAIIKKENALAYFNTRNEDEIVVDSFAIKDKMIIEK